MTMITPSYLGETIEYSSLHACRSTLEDPTSLGLILSVGRSGVCHSHIRIPHDVRSLRCLRPVFEHVFETFHEAATIS